MAVSTKPTWHKLYYDATDTFEGDILVAYDLIALERKEISIAPSRHESMQSNFPAKNQGSLLDKALGAVSKP